MKVEFHPDAAEEFAATAVYYNGERYGLGHRFRDAVVNAIDRIGQFPQIGRPGARWRRLQVAGFPYDLVYRVRGDVLEVLALAHHRRRPGYWKARAR